MPARPVPTLPFTLPHPVQWSMIIRVLETPLNTHSSTVAHIIMSWRLPDSCVVFLEQEIFYNRWPKDRKTQMHYGHPGVDEIPFRHLCSNCKGQFCNVKHMMFHDSKIISSHLYIEKTIAWRSRQGLQETSVKVVNLCRLIRSSIARLSMEIW